MRVWAHDRWAFPLPAHHRYPVDRHRLLRERLERIGICRPGEVQEAQPAAWAQLTRVQDAALLGRIRRGELSVREQRGLGLPWSPELVQRGRRVAIGTVLAAREAQRVGVAMNLGGGSHHAGRDFARGYCLFNDVAFAVGALRDAGMAQRALVVDCDVHQGDGTAQLLGPDPLAFTLSLHGARNYPFRRIPSDLDLDLRAGTPDGDYLEALDGALARALAAPEAAAGYEIAFYLAGADPWEGDRLGSLALTKAGLRDRDALVLDTLGGAGVPVCVVLAGGYAPDVADIVDINVATAREVAARTRSAEASIRDRYPRAMELGPPISYKVLEPGVPVLSSDEQQIGKVVHVLADEATDVFDGIVIAEPGAAGHRFADADEVREIHERGVLLTLSAVDCEQLPRPTANPAVMDEDPADPPEHGIAAKLSRAWDLLSGNY